MMIMKIPCSISIDEKTVFRVDSFRHQVPRSRVLEDAINLGISQVESQYRQKPTEVQQ